jgi:hypothetical protein
VQRALLSPRSWRACSLQHHGPGIAVVLLGCDPCCTGHGLQELESWQQVFLDFYMKKYGGRRLQWCHSLGTCVLRAHFPKGTKELSVSLFQAAVLCLFNDSATMNYAVSLPGSPVTTLHGVAG